MNFLSLFVVIPLLMMGGLWAAREMKQIRVVMAAGASALLALAVTLACLYVHRRAAGDTAGMLFTGSVIWYAPFHIRYAVGVDGLSVAMLQL